MGYEAQIAGFGEKIQQMDLKLYHSILKKISNADYSKRREAIVKYIQSKGHKLRVL